MLKKKRKSTVTYVRGKNGNEGTNRILQCFIRLRIEALLFSPWYQGVIKLMPTFDHIKKVVEIGCGTGTFLKVLGKTSDVYLVGVDFSSVALKSAFKRIKALKNIDLVLADAHHLPFKNYCFNTVICCEVIEHLEDPANALEELHRIMMGDASLIVSFPNYCAFLYLLVRLIADISRKWKLITRQPKDSIFTLGSICKMFLKQRFAVIKIYGTCYIPPGLFTFFKLTKLPDARALQIMERLDSQLRKLLNKHPILCYFSLHPCILVHAPGTLRTSIYFAE